MDLIIKLLDKDRNNRIGSNGGAKEILAHPLFKRINPDKVYNKTLKPPFIPEVDKAEGMKFFNVNKDTADTIIPKNAQQVVKSQDELFEGFEKTFR